MPRRPRAAERLPRAAWHCPRAAVPRPRVAWHRPPAAARPRRSARRPRPASRRRRRPGGRRTCWAEVGSPGRRTAPPARRGRSPRRPARRPGRRVPRPGSPRWPTPAPGSRPGPGRAGARTPGHRSPRPGPSRDRSSRRSPWSSAVRRQEAGRAGPARREAGRAESSARRTRGRPVGAWPGPLPPAAAATRPRRPGRPAGRAARRGWTPRCPAPRASVPAVAAARARAARPRRSPAGRASRPVPSRAPLRTAGGRPAASAAVRDCGRARRDGPGPPATARRGRTPGPPGAQVQLGHRGLGEALAQRGPGEQGQRGDGRRLRVARAGTAAQETGVRQAERAGQRVGDLRLPCRRLRVRVRPGVGRGRGPAGPGARGVVGGGTGRQQAEPAAESVAVQQVAQPGGTVRRRVVAHPDDQQLVQVIGAVGEGQLDTHAGLDRLEPVGFPALLFGAEHADRQRVGHRTAELVHRDPAVDQPDETPAPGHRDHPPPVFVRVVGTQRGRRGAGAAGADRPGGACRAQQCEHLLPGFGARTLPVLGARGGLRGGELRVELREQDVVRVDAHPKRARLPPDGLQPHRQERDRGGVVVGEQRGAGGQGLRQFLRGAADGTVQLVGRALRLRLGCLRGGEHVGRGALVAGLDGGLEPPHHGQLLVRAGLRGVRLCACPVQLRAGGERVGHVRGAPVLDTVISRPARWWP